MPLPLTLPPETLISADPAPGYVYAPTDFRPRGARERELCESASRPDWIYMSGVAASHVLALYLSSDALKQNGDEYVHAAGGGLVGLTLGWAFSGIYLSLPKCDPNWVSFSPPEGNVRSSIPLALTMAGASAVLSPIMLLAAAGPPDVAWSNEHRAGRFVAASVFGAVGAFLPYALPPKTWRAAQELARIRAGGDNKGAFVSYTVSF